MKEARLSKCWYALMWKMTVLNLIKPRFNWQKCCFLTAKQCHIFLCWQRGDGTADLGMNSPTTSVCLITELLHHMLLGNFSCGKAGTRWWNKTLRKKGTKTSHSGGRTGPLFTTDTIGKSNACQASFCQTLNYYLGGTYCNGWVAIPFCLAWGHWFNSWLWWPHFDYGRMQRYS